MEDVPLSRVAEGDEKEGTPAPAERNTPREEPGSTHRAPVQLCRGRALSPFGGFRRSKLLGDLCPEAARWLYGDDGMTLIELFCEGRPAPAAVRLQATEMQG